MANSLTNLIPTLYEALDVVSRELVGFIPAVNRDSSADRAAVGETVVFPIVPQYTAADIVPANIPPVPTDSVIGNDSLSITKSRRIIVYWTGEETRGAQNAGHYQKTLRDQIAQAMRALCNEMELDLANLFVWASRAYGVASGHLFDATDGISSLAQIRKILSDDGAPLSDLHVVLDTYFAAALRSQSLLQKVNESGNDQMLRDGSLGRIMGIQIHESGAVAQHVKGTGASYVTYGSTAQGATGVVLATGSGTVLAGDVVTFAADAANKYVVNMGVAAPGTITIGKPGARMIIPTGNALTVANSFTPLPAFGRNALTLVTRAPALPDGGDVARDRVMIQDEKSGLAFEVAQYPEYRQLAYEVSIAWGVKCTKQEHLALLMGT